MEKRSFVGYFRVSTRRQGLSGLGLEAQQTAVRQFLGPGDELLASFVEVETGTRKGNNRPELAKALAFCRRERATLVIAKLDRLARNVAVISNLMESKADFVAVDIPTANRLTLHVLAAVAESEAEAISARTRAALGAAKARGTVLGKPENLTPEARRAGAQACRTKAIAAYGRLTPLVSSLRDRGESLRAIARYLNDLGEVTRDGREFTPATIHRILARAASLATDPQGGREATRTR